MGRVFQFAKRLGIDTTTDIERTYPLYKYTIEDRDNNTIGIGANDMTAGNEILYFSKRYRPIVGYDVFGFPKYVTMSKTIVHEHRIDAIKTMKREHIDDQTYVVTIDRATEEIVDWEIQ